MKTRKWLITTGAVFDTLIKPFSIPSSPALTLPSTVWKITRAEVKCPSVS